jgi:HSP20 family molecular chaperone IbpA
LKGEKDLIVDEWSVGPYDRDLTLPVGVDGPRANVTYDNGVLVVAVPVGATTTPARLTVPRVGEARGQRAGNAGHSSGASR